jgi:hypothetical protein
VNIAGEVKVACGTHVGAAGLALFGGRHSGVLDTVDAFGNASGWRGVLRWRAWNGSGHALGTELGAVRLIKDTDIANRCAALMADECGGDVLMLIAFRTWCELKGNGGGFVHAWWKGRLPLRKQDLEFSLMDGAAGGLSIGGLERAHALWTDQLHDQRVGWPR